MMDENMHDPRQVVDREGNMFQIVGPPIGGGGQGEVYRTDDPDLAIKICRKDSRSHIAVDYGKLFQNIRMLPLPPHLHVTLPLSILQDEQDQGYVMRLMAYQKPIGEYLPNSNDFNAILASYKSTGAGKSRLQWLASAATTLARLHASGIVYGDISPNNIFVSESDGDSTWFIDSDNLRFESLNNGETFHTPRYAAPELVRGEDGARPTSDVYAFALLAFHLLTMVYPLEEPETDDFASNDFSDGEYIDAPGRECSVAVGLPLENVLTPELRELFRETFCEGCFHPWKRPSMLDFAKTLQTAADTSLMCPKCGYSSFYEFEQCPWCDAPYSHYCLVESANGKKMVLQDENAGVYHLPQRLFGAFLPATQGESQYEVEINFDERKAKCVRGAKALPRGLKFGFM